MASSPGSDTQTSTRLKITEAAALLLREVGVHGVTTRAVASAAGVPTPTIFRTFGDKDGLLDAVAEHVMSIYVAAKSRDALHEIGNPVDDLRDAWRTHIEFGLTNPDLYVLISTPGRLPVSPATAAGTGVLEERVRRLAEAGLLAVSEPRAVGLIHAAGTGAIFALLHQPAEGRDTSLSDAMLEAVLRTIVTTNPVPPTLSLAPLAIAFRAAIPDLPALTDGERTLLTEWVTRTIAGLSD